MTNIAVCVPHGGQVPVKFLFAQKELEVHTIMTRNDVVLHYIDVDTHVVSLARHTIVEKAADVGVEWLFWLDDDTLPPKDALVRLLAHGLDFVSGLYFARVYPHQPQMYQREGTVFRTMHKYEEGLVTVGAVGHGCCLVKAEVYQRLQNVPVQEVYGRPMSPWYEFHTGLGEDFYFCNRLAQIGVPVVVDTTVKCDHLLVSAVGERHFNQLKEAGTVTDE